MSFALGLSRCYKGVESFKSLRRSCLSIRSISVRSVGSESLGHLFGDFVSADTHLSVAPLGGSLCCGCLMTELYVKNNELPNATPK